MKTLIFSVTLCMFLIALPVTAKTNTRAKVNVPGDDLHAAKQYGPARQVYLEVARTTNDTTLSATAKVRAAICLFHLKQPEAFKAEAEALLQQIQDRRIPKKIYLVHNLAELPFLLGNWAEAEKKLGQFIAEHPKFELVFKPVQNRAWALGQLKRYSEARQAYLDFIKTTKNDRERETASFKATLLLYRMKDYERFVQESAQVCAKYPSHAGNDIRQMKFNLAQVSLDAGNRAEAADQLGKFIAENASGATKFQIDLTDKAVQKRVRALLKLNRREEARQTYLAYIPNCKDPALQEVATFKAALSLYELEQYEKLKSEGTAVLSQYPANTTKDAELLRFYIAMVPGKQGRWSESADQLEALVNAHPTLPQVMLNCGRAFLNTGEQLSRQGDHLKAAEYHAKGIAYVQRTRADLERKIFQGEIEPTNGFAHTMILESYYDEKNYQGLAQAAQALATEQFPPSRPWAQGMLWLGIANMYLNPPDVKGAATAFDAVLSVDVLAAQPNCDLVVRAAFWRGAIAQMQNEQSKVDSLVTLLRRLPDGPEKKAALERLAGEQTPTGGPTASSPLK